MSCKTCGNKINIKVVNSLFESNRALLSEGANTFSGGFSVNKDKLNQFLQPSINACFIEMSTAISNEIVKLKKDDYFNDASFKNIVKTISEKYVTDILDKNKIENLFKECVISEGDINLGATEKEKRRNSLSLLDNIATVVSKIAQHINNIFGAYIPYHATIAGENAVRLHRIQLILNSKTESKLKVVSQCPPGSSEKTIGAMAKQYGYDPETNFCIDKGGNPFAVVERTTINEIKIPIVKNKLNEDEGDFLDSMKKLVTAPSDMVKLGYEIIKNEADLTPKCADTEHENRRTSKLAPRSTRVYTAYQDLADWFKTNTPNSLPNDDVRYYVKIILDPINEKEYGVQPIETNISVDNTNYRITKSAAPKILNGAEAGRAVKYGAWEVYSNPKHSRCFPERTRPKPSYNPFNPAMHKAGDELGHKILDILGVLDPSGFADALNFLWYMKEYQTETSDEAKNQIVINAAMSLLGAVIPYAGDLVKVANFGARSKLALPLMRRIKRIVNPTKPAIKNFFKNVEDIISNPSKVDEWLVSAGTDHAARQARSSTFNIASLIIKNIAEEPIQFLKHLKDSTKIGERIRRRYLDSSAVSTLIYAALSTEWGQNALKVMLTIPVDILFLFMSILYERKDIQLAIDDLAKDPRLANSGDGKNIISRLRDALIAFYMKLKDYMIEIEIKEMENETVDLGQSAGALGLEESINKKLLISIIKNRSNKISLKEVKFTKEEIVRIGKIAMKETDLKSVLRTIDEFLPRFKSAIGNFDETVRKASVIRIDNILKNTKTWRDAQMTDINAMKAEADRLTREYVDSLSKGKRADSRAANEANQKHQEALAKFKESDKELKAKEEELLDTKAKIENTKPEAPKGLAKAARVIRKFPDYSKRFLKGYIQYWSYGAVGYLICRFTTDLILAFCAAWFTKLRVPLEASLNFFKSVGSLTGVGAVAVASVLSNFSDAKKAAKEAGKAGLGQWVAGVKGAAPIIITRFTVFFGCYLGVRTQGAVMAAELLEASDVPQSLDVLTKRFAKDIKGGDMLFEAQNEALLQEALYGEMKNRWWQPFGDAVLVPIPGMYTEYGKIANTFLRSVDISYNVFNTARLLFIAKKDGLDSAQMLNFVASEMKESYMATSTTVAQLLVIRTYLKSRGIEDVNIQTIIINCLFKDLLTSAVQIPKNSSPEEIEKFRGQLAAVSTFFNFSTDVAGLAIESSKDATSLRGITEKELAELNKKLNKYIIKNNLKIPNFPDASEHPDLDSFDKAASEYLTNLLNPKKNYDLVKEKEKLTKSYKETDEKLAKRISYYQNTDGKGYQANTDGEKRYARNNEIFYQNMRKSNKEHYDKLMTDKIKTEAESKVEGAKIKPEANLNCQQVQEMYGDVYQRAKRIVNISRGHQMHPGDQVIYIPTGTVFKVKTVMDQTEEVEIYTDSEKKIYSQHRFSIYKKYNEK